MEEPDVEFGMDQYSEATLITKPTVCLSLQEVANIHQCLVEYESVLAPDPDDCLHQILDDFATGDQRNHPSIQYLLAGDTKENVGTFQVSLSFHSDTRTRRVYSLPLSHLLAFI